MSDNFVIVKAQFTDLQPVPTYGTGNFEFVASGLLMDSGQIAIVTPIIRGQLDSQGALSMPTGSIGTVSPGTANTGLNILASDSFPAGDLLWNIKLQVQGVPDIIANNVAVNFAAGATQGLFDILSAAGWTATVPPNVRPV